MANIADAPDGVKRGLPLSGIRACVPDGWASSPSTAVRSRPLTRQPRARRSRSSRAQDCEITRFYAASGVLWARCVLPIKCAKLRSRVSPPGAPPVGCRKPPVDGSGPRKAFKNDIFTALTPILPAFFAGFDDSRAWERAWRLFHKVFHRAKAVKMLQFQSLAGDFCAPRTPDSRRPRNDRVTRARTWTRSFSKRVSSTSPER